MAIFHSPSHGFDLTRVFVDGAGPAKDRRVAEVRHIDMPYTFPTYRTKQDWLARADYLRHHILVSNGLFPMPERTRLHAKVFGKIEREGYTIEKAYFESYPGFFVTGNLYRPKGKKEPFPGILNPHGHWSDGRFANSEKGSVPARCIHFARQGYVAFAYDMVGYNDSQQVPHRFREPRSALWGISVMGLQLWNSIRSIDFLCSLPDVDTNRIACTGTSGGGTQTFMVMAVDDRIKVAAPVCMVSAHMQGGCSCENAPNLRLDTYNVEIAAMMAPRPLILVAATGDWTKDTLQVEYPAIQSIYRLFNAEENVHAVRMDAEHNYNRDSREAVYAWFGRWLLSTSDESQFVEQPFRAEEPQDLLVFHERERPENAVDLQGLLDQLISSARKQLEEQKPQDESRKQRFRDQMGLALRHALAAECPSEQDVVATKVGTTERQDFTAYRLLVGRRGKGDQIPAILFVPADATGPVSATLIVHPDGKEGLVDVGSGRLDDLLIGLLRQGQAVLAIDCFLTGEFHTPFSRTERQEITFFETYNRTDTALRVQDILTALAYLHSREDVSSVNLAGLGKAGLWCLLARGLASGIDRTIVDVARFDNEDDNRFVEEVFVPLLRRAGDFRIAGALAAPHPLLIHNTGDAFQTSWISDVYRALGAGRNLSIKKEEATFTEVLQWLMEQ